MCVVIVAKLLGLMHLRLMLGLPVFVLLGNLWHYILQGIALTDMQSIPPVIWHFSASDLPDDPVLR